MLISRPSQERFFYNFSAQQFPIFIFWHKYATRAIPREHETATVFRRPMAQLISQPSWERSFYNFRARPLPIFVIRPKYATREILRDSETATFFVHPIAHANIPALPGALLL